MARTMLMASQEFNLLLVEPLGIYLTPSTVYIVGVVLAEVHVDPLTLTGVTLTGVSTSNLLYEYCIILIAIFM